ncbi:MAG TPA: hypothetical protein VFX98_00205, partial [Longimicrobiaceae bacterium]|nr:hypothetical protein [Longimicrobiaceae bacterium]
TAAQADSLRRAALRRHRVTERDLKAFVAAHGRDAALMSEVWAEIAEKVEREDSIRRAREFGPPAVDTPRTLPPQPKDPRPDSIRARLLPPDAREMQDLGRP